MSRGAAVLLSAGVLLFIGVLVSQGLPAIFTALSRAGWSLIGVAAFHLVPLALDAMAIQVLFKGGEANGVRPSALLTRWVGESANSLMPAGQIGGPVLMIRYLVSQGLALQDAAAAITVSTTLQTFTQIAFALLGTCLLGVEATRLSEHALRTSALIASGVLAVQVGGFYLMQRRGLFLKLTRLAARFSAKHDWKEWLNHADSIDRAIEETYGRRGPVALSLFLSFVGWLVGTGEVYIICTALDHPVSWGTALLLESLGQAIRGAAFAVPGALGVQEGGYLLLAPIAGLPPDAALALSLAKRAREVLLGAPGLLYLHFHKRFAAQRGENVV